MMFFPDRIETDSAEERMCSAMQAVKESLQYIDWGVGSPKIEWIIDGKRVVIIDYEDEGLIWC
jgi:hypothetical protein